MQDFQIVVVIITIALNLVLAAIVLRSNPKSETNISLALFTIATGLWAIPNYMYVYAAEYSEILFWMRTVFFVTGFMIAALLYFSLAVPFKSLNISKLIKFLIFVPTIIIGVLSYTDLVVVSADIIRTGTHIPVFGYGMWYYVAVLFSYLIIAFISLSRKYRRAFDAKLKAQLNIIFIGLGIFTLPASITNLIFVFLFKETSYTAFGPAFSIVTVSLIAYAIAKHRFLDIRVLFGRIIYYTLLAFIPYFVYFFLSYAYLRFFGTIFSLPIYIISIGIAISFVFLFNYINFVLKNQVTVRFINPGYDPAVNIEGFSKELATKLEIESIVNDTIDVLQKTIRPDSIIFFIKSNQQKEDTLSTFGTTTLHGEVVSKLFVTGRSLVDAVGKHVVLRDQIPMDVIEGIYANTPNIAQILLEQMNEAKLKVFILLGTSKKPLGALMIGEKESDVAYSEQDANFLQSLEFTLSVAVERSLLYAEVQKFASSLQEKVDLATKELKDTNVELKTSLSQIQEARRKERDMMDVMGHELRTPLTIVRNALAMLERERVKTNGQVDPDRLQDYINKGLNSARREITLVETLLSATKIDASRLQLSLEKVSVNELIETGIEGQQAYIDEKKLQVVYTPPSPALFIYSDTARAHEIVDNFISNAAKYTPEGKIYINTWTTIDKVWIEIRDTGMGIDVQDLENLGKKFFRAKQHVKGKDVVRPGGTGLGLYVTFELIRIQGGELYINSEVGLGTSVTFSLPIYKNQAVNQFDQTFDAGQVENRQHIFLNRQPPSAQTGL